MTGVIVKQLEEFENNGVFFRARAGLGVTSFGMNVERWPPGADTYPEHDETRTGQEEVYVVLAGSARLVVGDEAYALEPGIFASVGPEVRRRIEPGEDGVTLLCLGGTPGAAFSPRRFTEEGAPWR